MAAGTAGKVVSAAHGGTADWRGERPVEMGDAVAGAVPGAVSDTRLVLRGPIARASRAAAVARQVLFCGPSLEQV